MEHAEFVNNIIEVIKADKFVIGLAVTGSWLTTGMDNFSDLDLILVTKDKITQDKEKMLAYAKQFGTLLSGFSGEHVGEPRGLICLYNDPLLHVDIKFVTLEEFSHRIETPIILADTNDQLKDVLANSRARYPYPDYQWIEDRFWIHYALLKIGRGEYLEAFDFFGFLRGVVFGPLLHIKNGHLPRGVRKVEMQLQPDDFNDLKQTIPVYERLSLIHSLRNAVTLYRKLRSSLFDENIILQDKTERAVMKYFDEIDK